MPGGLSRGGAYLGVLHPDLLRQKIDDAVDVLGGDDTHFGQVPRKAFTSAFRCPTSSSRERCNRSAVCCSGVLIGTARMSGRVTASQIASASAASVLPRLTEAFP